MDYGLQSGVNSLSRAGNKATFAIQEGGNNPCMRAVNVEVDALAGLTVFLPS